MPNVPANTIYGPGCTGQATLHVVTTDASIPGETSGTGSPLLQALYANSNLSFDFVRFFPADFYALPASSGAFDSNFRIGCSGGLHVAIRRQLEVCGRTQLASL